MINKYIFKGKREDNGEWVEGDLMQWGDEIMRICVDTGNDEKTAITVIPETVGQCTGLKDKNGKWIFAGDIVKLTDINNGVEWRACVVFGNPYGAYDWGWNLMYIGGEPNINTDILLWIEMEEAGAYCEVIGNIHDNPELLKEGDNK